MKHSTLLTLTLFLICFAAFSCQPKQKTARTPALMQITGNVEWNKSYCGGPSPSQEMLDELRTPKPLAGHKFYVKKGSSNLMETAIVTEVITDAAGNFKLELPPGEYVLLLEQQLNQNILSAPGKNIKVANKERLTSWWKRGLARINSSNKVINLKMRKDCNLPLGVPFLRYTGPVAP